MVYATITDLNGVLDRIPANAELLLIRASRDIDQALICAVYDPTSPAVIDTLRQATVEQVAGNLEDGDTSGLGGSSPQSFTIGSLSVTRRQTSGGGEVRRVGRLAEQAWLVLHQAGLTGHEPQDP